MSTNNNNSSSATSSTRKPARAADHGPPANANNEQVQLDTISQHTQILQKVMAQGVAQLSDVLCIDYRTESRFFDEVFKPIITRLLDSKLYTTSAIQVRKPSVARNTAQVQTIKYAGAKDAERRSIQVVTRPSDDDDDGDDDDDSDDLTTTEPSIRELQDMAGGVFIVYNSPVLRDTRRDPRPQGMFMASAQRLQKQMHRAREAMLRADSNDLARYNVFEYATMHDVVVTCLARAMSRGIPLPTDWERRLAVVELSAVPYRTSVMLAQCRAPCVLLMMDFFLPRSRLEFWNAMLVDESVVAKELHFRLAAVGAVNADVVPQEELLACDAAPAPVGDGPMRDLRAENPLVYELNSLYERDRSMVMKRHIDPSTGIAITILEPVAPDNIDDDDNDANNDVLSVASTTASLNSVLPRQVATATLDEETHNFFASRLDVHEMSDRLYAQPRTELLIGKCFAEHRAPARLVERFICAFSAGTVLFTRYCGNVISRWRAADLYYLYHLCQMRVLELKIHSIVGGSDSGGGGFSAFDQTLDHVVADEGLFDALEGDVKRKCLLAMVHEVFQSEHASMVLADVSGYFEKLQLNRVIDAFQVQRTSIERRERATLVPVRRASREELDAFIVTHGLYWFADRLAQLEQQARAASSFSVDDDNDAGGVGGGESPYDVVLRVSAHHATPLQLTTSVRAFVPKSRDGVDFLIVWQPDAYSIPNRARRSPNLRCLDVFIALRRSVWHVLACGAFPRVLAETRARGKALDHLPLAAPLLHAAMESQNPIIVADALSAMQAFATPARNALPTAWSADVARESGLFQVSRALQRVAHAFAIKRDSAPTPLHVRVAALPTRYAERLAARYTERYRLVQRVAEALCDRVAYAQPGRMTNTVPTDSIFAAIHVALAGNGITSVLTLPCVDALLARQPLYATLGANGRRFTEFVRAQRAVLRARNELPQRSAAHTFVAPLGAVQSDEQLLRLECHCGTSAQKCENMYLQLRDRQGNPNTPFRLMQLQCCLCISHNNSQITQQDIDAAEAEQAAAATIAAAAVINVNSASTRGLRGGKGKAPKKRKRTALPGKATCCLWCERRDVISTRLLDDQFCVLSDGANTNVATRLSSLEILSAMADAGDIESLRALRMWRGRRVLDVPVPRNSAMRRVSSAFLTNDAGDGGGGGGGGGDGANGDGDGGEKPTPVRETRPAMTAFASIVSATRTALEAVPLSVATAATSNKRIRDAGDAVARQRLYLLITCECAALVNHEDLPALLVHEVPGQPVPVPVTAVVKKEASASASATTTTTPLVDEAACEQRNMQRKLELMRALSPLDDVHLETALERGGAALLEQHERTLAFFPLCASVLAESTSVGAHSFQSTASDWRVRPHEAAAAHLVNGRTPRPFSGAMPLLPELTMMHWYEPEVPTPTATTPPPPAE